MPVRWRVSSFRPYPSTLLSSLTEGAVLDRAECGWQSSGKDYVRARARFFDRNFTSKRLHHQIRSEEVAVKLANGYKICSVWLSSFKYVAGFVRNNSGGHFSPHVSTGLAPRVYLDKMLAEPFESFTFSPTAAAVYQLGQFGTAAKKLKEWDLKP